MTSTTDSNSTLSSKKKRSPNWLPSEEEQLAISWINVSEQPEYAANQTGETFYKKVEADFNKWSTVHYRDYDQIRISALALFQDQTKGQFKSQLAWEKLRYHPKWRVEKKDIILPSFDPPLPASGSHELPESSKPGTPTSMTTASSRPMGSKAAKRQRLNFTDFKEDRASQAKEFNTLTKQKLIIIQEGIQVSKEKNEVELKRLKIEEEKLIIEKEHRASEVVMNELVLLSKCEDDIKDPDALEVLKKMKDKVKRKWLDS
ncbi:hypothetical protein PPACK8108_LOCUS19190 [Phakopsora pachyrhizi]|uniref:No apical meristem-associated C-terminal domain-containing protein n=1 Tax=Phakopsora pachyrhizi TaxID=170000 RepID=A0AAV0BGW3_PHAPC|nr:hypothetical protein PPACK8108_LOCUS19190 [Phakopsora pachyrhizi]